MTIREDVLRTAALIAHTQSPGISLEQAVVERLVSEGYSRIRAEVLVAFVPLGLGRALIARLPINPPVKLSNIGAIRDSDRNRTWTIKLDDVPEFAVALELGEETYASGEIPREHFKAACSISVELNLISQALNADVNPGGGEIAWFLIRLADAPGFEDWYRTIAGK